MKVTFGPRGEMKMIYDERLSRLGVITEIHRASVVEPKTQPAWWNWRQRWRLRRIPLNQWYADLAKSGGPVLGPFAARSQAIQAEVAWLEQNWRPYGEPPDAKEGRTPGQARCPATDSL